MTSHSVSKADGYDWLLNQCSDLDQATHAGHLDDGEFDPNCFYCREGEGRRPMPKVNARTWKAANPDRAREIGREATCRHRDKKAA
jgi:hypothetical protein